MYMYEAGRDGVSMFANVDVKNVIGPASYAKYLSVKLRLFSYMCFVCLKVPTTYVLVAK